MIVRIVNMHFTPEGLKPFLDLFVESKAKIRNFPGVKYLELIQDTHDKCKLSTYSHWESEEALENYRNSELFKTTWAKTKIHFQSKAKAVSFHPLYQEI